MNEIQPSQWKSDKSNITCNEEYYHHGISAIETIILPLLIGIICSTGLVGNVLIMVTILRYGMCIKHSFIQGTILMREQLVQLPSTNL